MKTIIIDVRTPKEFESGSLPGAVNIPSNNFTMTDYAPFKADQIALLCSSGNRASMVCEVLQENGFQHVSIMQHHMEYLSKHEQTTAKWSVDRQFRLVVGLLLATFLVGLTYGMTAFLILPTLICLGLILSVITNNCYLKIGIAALPWNRK
ncbi:MAG: rhodanese-like domain-containing protein [Flavobacteriales bacterium]|nr:rhodanese-like domain-containing protein [Bacteroidota bacterium]MCB9241971.1 rhodanese-like domain-containing protein [Flavobacteriales bacterium]